MKFFHKVLIGCLLFAIALYVVRTRQALREAVVQAAQEVERPLRLEILWKKPTQPISSISISPDSKCMVTIGPGDLVTSRDMTGRVLWQIRVKDATHALISARGEVTLVYSWMNPVERHLTFVLSNGAVRWRPTATASVWSAAVARDDPTFAVGSGDGRVVIYSVDEYHRRYIRWKTQGAVTSLDFIPNGNEIAYGTWQDSTIGVSRLDGTRVWQQPGDPDKLYAVRVAARGNTILALGTPNRKLPTAVASMYTIEGSLMWTRTLDGFDTVGDISGFGDLAALGLKRLIEHKEKEVPARYVLLMGQRGETLWEKGGIFFKPHLLRLTDYGMLVFDDKSLYGIDNSGKASAMLRLPGTIRLCRADRTGRAVVYCGDGNLYCIRLRPK